MTFLCVERGRMMSREGCERLLKDKWGACRMACKRFIVRMRVNNSYYHKDITTEFIAEKLKTMSVTQLADEIDMSENAIYHRLRKAKISIGGMRKGD